MPLYTSLLSLLNHHHHHHPQHQHLPVPKIPAPKILSVLPALLTAPCLRADIPLPYIGPEALKAFLEARTGELDLAAGWGGSAYEGVRESEGGGGGEDGWRAPEEVRECARELALCLGSWKGVSGRCPAWAQSQSQNQSLIQPPQKEKKKRDTHAKYKTNSKQRTSGRVIQ